ncbi:hypothetical protein V6N13_012123 [Hibiscus sabdariffa]|uniref:non-specific serine/threonine protein kinase n=1 Tax=Hibiscus sabdariffa TaxID=183260 RepID=A0ABR2SEC5_9ROSI
MGNNHFTGLIPKSVKICTSSTRLKLEGNQLNGIIAEGFGTYLNLKYIDLSYSQFVWRASYLINGDTTPVLTSLRFAKNHISAKYHLTLGKHIYLSLNHLTGIIQVELGRLTSLNIHLLNDNAVSASYSVAIQILAMQRLSLAGNDMEVQFPVN